MQRIPSFIGIGSDITWCVQNTTTQCSLTHHTAVQQITMQHSTAHVEYSARCCVHRTQDSEVSNASTDSATGMQDETTFHFFALSKFSIIDELDVNTCHSTTLLCTTSHRILHDFRVLFSIFGLSQLCISLSYRLVVWDPFQWWRHCFFFRLHS